MKKISTIVAFSILLIACGSTSESNVTEVIEQTTDIENTIIEETVNEEAPVDVIVEEVEEVEVIVEAAVKEIKQETVAEDKIKSKKVVKEVITKKVKEVAVETVVGPGKFPGPILIEVVRAIHNPWHRLANEHVTASGKVNYKGMKADLSKITTYLDHLKNTVPKSDWSKNEKLAYWINLYNASTVYLVASNYPTTSITKLNGGKPWDKKFVKSGDKVYSLNQIENDIVRPRFKDPRIHAALNCAAVSCPKMLNGAFLPSKLSAQLDMQTRAWINDFSRNEVTPSKLKLSKIFEWYAADFKAGGGVVAFVSKYNRSKIMIDPQAKISYLEYNWNLNE